MLRKVQQKWQIQAAHHCSGYASPVRKVQGPSLCQCEGHLDTKNINFVKIWIKPNGEMPFLYGNHVLKAHLGRITEDTPEHQGVVVFSMNDVPLVGHRMRSLSEMLLNTVQGFGVTARSTIDTRKLDPTSIIVFHQA
jgi:ribosome biogenesis protein Nip4